MKYILIVLLCSLGVQNAFAQYSMQSAFPNLPAFIQPTEMQIASDGTDRIFIAQQKGLIYFFHNDPAASSRKVFLDLSQVVSQPNPGGETGLIGLAFHPDFKTNGFFYVNYTSSPNGQLTSHISRFHVDPASPDTVLNNTEQVLLTLAQPYANHNGGRLVFGPDGYLYASFGDGGSGGDPQNRAQNRDSLFGKILRLDVDHEANGLHYAIPPDNPYANNTNTFRKEIYAYGLRNVWKFSFDRMTGKLWAGDVGQNKYEEIDTINSGGNYGWNRMEGFHCYPSGDFSCDSTGLIPPIWEYNHNAGDVAIIGGFVYRGTTIPSLIGKYIYGDYSSNRIWALTYDGLKTPTNKLLIDKSSPALNLSAIGEDQHHELFQAGYSDGKIYKLVSSEAPLQFLPQFTNHIHGGIDTIDVKSNDTGSSGLKSITWHGTAGTADTSKFLVTLENPVLSCNSDLHLMHHIFITQKDPAIPGCFIFTFTDCANNQSFDTVCFAKHSLIIPDTINFGIVAGGISARKTITISEFPNDGNKFHIDSIFILPYSALAVFNITVTPPGLPLNIGTDSVVVRYLPFIPLKTDTALIGFHSAGTIDSFHYVYLTGSSTFANGSVNSTSDADLSMGILENPFKEKTSVHYSIKQNGIVVISLFDELGKEIKLMNKPQQAGSYSFDLDGSILSSGNYILRLESNGKVISRKIIKE